VSWLHSKKLLAKITGFSCYSTLRRWLYAKCRPGLTLTLNLTLKRKNVFRKTKWIYFSGKCPNTLFFSLLLNEVCGATILVYFPVLPHLADGDVKFMYLTLCFSYLVGNSG